MLQELAKELEFANTLQGKVTEFEDLLGRCLTSIDYDDYSMRMYLTKDNYVEFYHEQDCCEYVYIEDICGDLEDLIGYPLVEAEEVVEDASEADNVCESGTWTFYKFRTEKGSVVIRWLGESNGYYSESVNYRVVG